MVTTENEPYDFSISEMIEVLPIMYECHNTQSINQFLNIPDDSLISIIKFFSAKDIFYLKRTCRRFWIGTIRLNTYLNEWKTAFSEKYRHGYFWNTRTLAVSWELPLPKEQNNCDDDISLVNYVAREKWRNLPKNLMNTVINIHELKHFPILSNQTYIHYLLKAEQIINNTPKFCYSSTPKEYYI